ncbi:hypothetical protein ACFRFH_01905 [Leifsonia sp. NPDC056824]|uniref:hypothetical protein n=1 Tax=Leifsonia sp. NPDC056824 TaxID=3345953 RepID=UPI00367C104F
MSDTTPDPADKRDEAGSAEPASPPATAPAESAAAEPAPHAESVPAEPAPAPAGEPHDTDPEMSVPPSAPVSARGHLNRPADDAATEVPAAPAAPAATPPTAAIEPEPVATSPDDVAAAVARSSSEPGAAAAGDATVDTASPAQSAAPVIIAGEAAQQATAQPATAQQQQPPAAPQGEATAAAAPVAQTPPPFIPQPVAPIFLQRPEPPKRKSNRGIGILIALVGTVAFAVLWAVAVVVVGAMLTPSSEFLPVLTQYFTTQLAGWAPIVAFFVGMVVLIQIINRARWWAYILGGLVVAVFVYLVYIGAELSDAHYLSRNAEEQALILSRVWVNPFAVLAGVIAREMSVWTGAWLAARGRKLKARNAEAQADYEQQLADAQNQAANAYAQGY